MLPYIQNILEISIKIDKFSFTDEKSNEPEIIYLKASPDKTWNTDATGTSKGADRSTDRNGIERSAKPYIDIPRELGSGTTVTQNAVMQEWLPLSPIHLQATRKPDTRPS